MLGKKRSLMGTLAADASTPLIYDKEGVRRRPSFEMSEVDDSHDGGGQSDHEAEEVDEVFQFGRFKGDQRKIIAKRHELNSPAAN